MSLEEGMVVEWLGGPDDGKRFVLRAETEYIKVMLPPDLTAIRKIPGNEPAEVEIETVMVPIQQFGSKYYAMWQDKR